MGTKNKSDLLKRRQKANESSEEDQGRQPAYSFRVSERLLVVGGKKEDGFYCPLEP
jgi:hypothetical protein